MPKKNDPRSRITDAELSILEVLWSDGPQSIRALTDRLYPRGTNSDYATVQKLLERLEGKGCVRRDRSSFKHTFDATVAREALIGEQLENVAEKLCDGSFASLLVHLVESRKLGKRDRDMLRRLLDERGAETVEKQKRRRT